MSATRRPRFPDEEPNNDLADPRPRRSRPPPTPQPLDDDDEGRPAPSSRHKSILVDPNEDPKARQQRRRSRSNSRVRVKPPPTDHHSSDDEGTVQGDYIRHRNGEVEFVPSEPKRRKHDLEKKNGDGDKKFRARRDGYESDEGEQLKKAKKRGPRDARDNIGDVDDDETYIEKPKGRSARDSQYVKRSGGKSDDRAFAIPDRTRPRGDRDDEMAVGRRRDLGRRKYDSDEEDVDIAPARRPQYRRAPESRHERGYDSEGPSRRRGEVDDRYQDKRRPARYDDDYVSRRPDARQDRRRSLPRQSRNDDDYYDRRDRGGRDDAPIRRARSDAKGRDRDRYVDRRGGGGGGGGADGRGGKKIWMDQAGTLFMTHAMPLIKREGGRWAKSQLETYMSQRR